MTSLGIFFIAQNKLTLPPFTIFDACLTGALVFWFYFGKSRLAIILLILHFLIGKIIHWHYFVERPFSIVVIITMLCGLLVGARGVFKHKATQAKEMNMQTENRTKEKNYLLPLGWGAFWISALVLCGQLFGGVEKDPAILALQENFSWTALFTSLTYILGSNLFTILAFVAGLVAYKKQGNVAGSRLIFLSCGLLILSAICQFIR